MLLNRRPALAVMLVLGAASAALPLACGGRPNVSEAPQDAGAISGVAIKGRVAGATVKVFRLDGAERGAEVGSASTADDGTFTVGVGTSEGPYLVVVSAGSFVDEATGAQVALNNSELTALVPKFSVGQKLDGLLVTPVSHFAAGLALFYVKNEELALELADAEAWRHLNGHFGAVDWRKVTPADMTVERGPQVDDSVKAGLILAALSMEARLISQSAGITPGGAVSSLTVNQALYSDLTADGFFDGVGGQGQLVLPIGMEVAPQPPTATRLDGNAARAELSRAMALFLESERNLTAIKSVDVLALRDLIAGNSNPRIFRTPGAKDDDKAPVVTFSAQFVLADGGVRPSVGAEQLVGSSLIVTADATDVSGVKSLALSVDGSPVPPVGQGNTLSHFVGTWTAQDAGSLSFAAVAADVRGNQATTLHTVVVDTAAPSTFVVRPLLPLLADGGTASSAGYMSSALQVEATASDDRSLVSLVAEGLEGFTDNDTAVNHVVGTWTIPSTAAEGPAELRYVACDAVENCSTTKVAFDVDRTAPFVILDSTPPDYTKASTISFTVRADDDGIAGPGAGVKQVYAQINGVAPVYLGTQSTTDPTQWTFSNLSLGTGRNVFTVWGEDFAQPSNSGKGTGRDVTFTVIQDLSAPTVTAVPVLSYLSEQGLDFQRNADGTPVMPVVYTQTATTKTDISTATDFYKAAQRLKCGSNPPSAADFDGTNPKNIPFYKFAVNFDAASDAPITSATFRVQYQGSSTFETAVPLVESGSAPAGQKWFYLPICIETFPKLFQSINLPMFIQVSVTDGAGNTGGTTFSTPLFRTVGTPVAVVEDANYSTLNDAKGVYVYKRSAQNYQQLFDPANGNLANGARVLRYRIYNPSAEPIAFRVFQTNGIHSIAEGWQGLTFQLNSNITGGSTYAVDGFNFNLTQAWDSAPGSRVSTACSIPSGEVYPCGTQNRDTNFPYHQVGSTSSYSCRNQPLPPYTNNVNILMGNMASYEYFKNPSATGNETTAADAVNTSYKLVPAASGNTAGQLVLYIVMGRATTSTPSRAARPLIFQANPIDASSKYQFWFADYWSWTGAAAYQCGTTADTQLMQYVANRWYEQLTSATESVTYAQDVFTQALVPDSTQPSGYALFGPSTKVITNASTTRSYNH